MPPVTSSQRSVGSSSQSSQDNDVNTQDQNTQPREGVMTRLRKKITFNPFRKESPHNGNLENLRHQAGHGMDPDLRMAKALKEKPGHDKFAGNALRRKRNDAHQLNTNNARSTEVVNKMRQNFAQIVAIADKELEGDMRDEPLLYIVALKQFPDLHAAEFALELSDFIKNNSEAAEDMSVTELTTLGKGLIELASKFCVIGAEKEVSFDDAEKNAEKKLQLMSNLEKLDETIKYTELPKFGEYEDYLFDKYKGIKERILSEISPLANDFMKHLLEDAKFQVQAKINSLDKKAHENFTNSLTKEIMKQMIDDI